MQKKGDLAPPRSKLELSFGGAEHRQFPRARLGVRVALWVGEGADRRFSASLATHDLSVSGAFLESSFFLPLGTVLRLAFSPSQEEDAVQAQGEIVREEREGDRNGFALRFTEFFNQSEVTLAKLFVADQLREFAEEYLASPRARALDEELDRVVDTLAAWELKKVTSPDDTWGLNKQKRSA